MMAFRMHELGQEWDKTQGMWAEYYLKAMIPMGWASPELSMMSPIAGHLLEADTELADFSRPYHT